MAAATVTARKYGWNVTGDTGAVVVDTRTDVILRGLIFTPQANGNAVVITDKDSVAFCKIIGATADTSTFVDFGYHGVRMNGLRVASLSNAGDFLEVLIG